MARAPLSPSSKTEFACWAVLHWIVLHPATIHSALLEQEYQHIESILQTLERQELIAVDEKNKFIPTELGLKKYDHLIEQQKSYHIHFDIYSHVDLQLGCFADKKRDLLEDNRWSDLRVVIAEFKGIDPYQVVFLSLLSEGSFFHNPDWTFDLALGTFFDDLSSIIQDQLTVLDLEYRDERGEIISGEDVLRDVIAQGELTSKPIIN